MNYNKLLDEYKNESSYNKSMVADVIKFYWKEVKKEMEEPSTNRLYINKIGNFQINWRRLKTLSDKTGVKITSLRKVNKAYGKSFQKLVNKQKRLNSIQELIDKEREYIHETRLKQIQYYGNIKEFTGKQLKLTEKEIAIINKNKNEN